MSQTSPETSSRKIATSVIATVLAAAIIGAVGYWWRPLGEAVGDTGEWLMGPVSVSRLWHGVLWLCLLLTLLTIGGLVFGYFFAGQGPAHHRYRADHFFGLLWRWDWTTTGLVRLTAFCPECQRIMRYSEEARFQQPPLVQYHCQGCHHAVTSDGPHEEVLTQVEIEVRHRLDTGKWQQTM